MRRTAAALLLLTAAPLVPAAAQESRGISLEEAVRAALERSPTLRADAAGLEALRGAVAVEEAQWDPALRTYASGVRERSPSEDDPGAGVLATGIAYGLQAEKRFPWGLSLVPEVEVTRVDAAGLPLNRARAGLALVLPVLRGGRRAAEGVDAAREALASGHEAHRHAASEQALAAVQAYWGYVAAQRTLEAQREAEARAGTLVEETRALIDAEERPPADLLPVEANLAARRAATAAAEQAVVEARSRLGTVTGWTAETTLSLPPPATDFPPPASPPAAGDADRLADAALARRADLASAEREMRAARLRLRAAEDGLRPRLDLTLRTDYTGAAQGGEARRLLSTLYGPTEAWSTSLEVSWSLEGRGAARGRSMQERAALRVREVERGERARAVRLGVAVAVEGVRHARSGLEEAERAAELYAEVVRNETRRFQLGMSTLFDVIQAQDGLTGARVDLVAARRRYAEAVARLRWETGTLLAEDADGGIVVEVERLTTIPR